VQLGVLGTKLSNDVSRIVKGLTLVAMATKYETWAIVYFVYFFATQAEHNTIQVQIQNKN